MRRVLFRPHESEDTVNTVTINMTRDFDDAVRHRTGKTGRVTVRHEEWDMGYCETCSWPITGFAVYIDGERVYGPDSDGQIVDDERIEFEGFFVGFLDWLEESPDEDNA